MVLLRPIPFSRSHMTVEIRKLSSKNSAFVRLNRFILPPKFVQYCTPMNVAWTSFHNKVFLVKYRFCYRRAFMTSKFMKIRFDSQTVQSALSYPLWAFFKLHEVQMNDNTDSYLILQLNSILNNINRNSTLLYCYGSCWLSNIRQSNILYLKVVPGEESAVLLLF